MDLHLGLLRLADVRDAFPRFKISRLCSFFFALPEVLGEEVLSESCVCVSATPQWDTHTDPSLLPERGGGSDVGRGAA